MFSSRVSTWAPCAPTSPLVAAVGGVAVGQEVARAVLGVSVAHGGVAVGSAVGSVDGVGVTGSASDGVGDGVALSVASRAGGGVTESVAPSVASAGEVGDGVALAVASTVGDGVVLSVVSTVDVGDGVVASFVSTVGVGVSVVGVVDGVAVSCTVGDAGGVVVVVSEGVETAVPLGSDSSEDGVGVSGSDGSSLGGDVGDAVETAGVEFWSGAEVAEGSSVEDSW